jgi:trehalose 6-phosphate phosphatase
MKRLLLARNLEVIEQIAWSHALLAFDFDGTLAPIVAARDAASMRRTTFTLFKRVCALYPTAVISGRSRRDVASRITGAAVRYVVGNHGLEPGADSPETERALGEARLALGRLAEKTQGLDLEDKRYSLAVHYRRARRRRAARAAVLSVLARLETPMRVVPGKLVLNVVLASAPNKGDALLALREREQADIALYVGDDVTDEDVFRLDQPGRLLTVRVERSRTSAAAYFLRDQHELDELLRHLITFRERASR